MRRQTKSLGEGEELKKLSFLTAANGTYLEALFEDFLADPHSIDPSLKDFFQTLGDTAVHHPQGQAEVSLPLPKDSLKSQGSLASTILGAVQDTTRALKLMRAYEDQGHLLANLDPLGIEKPLLPTALDPKTYGFTEKDYHRPIYIQGALGRNWATLEEIIQTLTARYGQGVGVEFNYIQDAAAKEWIQNEIETRRDTLKSILDKHALLSSLTRAEVFEKFLALKFPGAKRFGLEGGESFIPLLEKILHLSTTFGLKEAIIGMAHRGRLNVLANIIGKPLRAIFSEFQGKFSSPEDMRGSGDVKYHLGASVDRLMPGGQLHLSLVANPSHLEAVNPVVVGKVRAKQAHLQDVRYEQVIGILVHGDAAFAGQGVVGETFLLSNLEGYRTGGTIHIIINNQVGFTTSPLYARSSFYCSDVAKVIQAPVIHVNGDEPEAVLWAAYVAANYRSRFKRDVVIDLVCYRRHGHNEMDEPSFTQPVMYHKIRFHPTTRELYAEKLLAEGTLQKAEADQMLATIQREMQHEFTEAANFSSKKADWLAGLWERKTFDIRELEGETGIDEAVLQRIGALLVKVPSGFSLHPKLDRLLVQKRQMFETGEGIDWATAEACAFGSLLKEGYKVRLSGQDVGRGTFSQRHAVWVDQQKGTKYIPLNHLSEKQGDCEIIDSPLAEASVLGFELGYSLADPDTLVLWEAQFGDFANGAQVIIDQFISAQEAKWLRLSGLVMLLPHGYEGQGPEHSSARLERYLQLCAEDNMIVANCTTPANYFHILRRQLVRPVRKPLIILTPKSLLRDQHALSPLKALGPNTSFQKVLAEPSGLPAGSNNIHRVILCSGKIAYALMEAKEREQRQDVLIIRLEQLYPFPHAELGELLKSYRQATFIWCQEEPQNMGAWSFIDRRFEGVLKEIEAKVKRPLYIGRPEAAATATGFYKQHEAEQQQLIQEALGPRG